LRRLRVEPETEIYVGLIHFADGVEEQCVVSKPRSDTSRTLVWRQNADSAADLPRGSLPFLNSIVTSVNQFVRSTRGAALGTMAHQSS
jgi:hypothetical protein